MVGIESAGIEAGSQVLLQSAEQMYDKGTFNPTNIDYSKINIDWMDVAGTGLTGKLLSPSLLDTNKGSLLYSINARKTLMKQLKNAKSKTKIDKLNVRIKGHNETIINNINFQGRMWILEKGLSEIFTDKDNKE